ncbi:hypothetical protein BM43_503 [Burkholderia gladioli]|uniref:DUF1566 domain-containing protein n=1 Tax=Burkholderia gladioli TaxID=28095 RepID=A0A095HTM3_BURGA|nr:DUF1566 domain-containing protein [Burkholderia gladioli]AJX00996.1 hypothetical protein BM43_503 [Burkholderia gladioli]ASD80435.1 hypothetical protein CEJ98_16590 [Burkholderia gladioli pv. gladioli]AWY54326.1 hypothetical protein A8H28_24535 [Burkholderia gladioli pv. gladioli]KGC16924.1 hypothetical protein DM48_5141 [Burkholderia gladioli]PEH37382.1 hypothetical protein CRM94_22835 [Burkholderia gladioli]
MLTIEISGDTIRLTSNSHNQAESTRTVVSGPAVSTETFFELGEVATDAHGDSIGIYAGIMRGMGDATDYHLFLVDGDTKLAWKHAMAWGAQAGDSLPRRREQSLLFANLPEHFAKEPYWSCEESESNSGWAWCQYFGNGSQGSYRQDNEFRARAVRRLFI